MEGEHRGRSGTGSGGNLPKAFFFFSRGWWWIHFGLTDMNKKAQTDEIDSSDNEDCGFSNNNSR